MVQDGLKEEVYSDDQLQIVVLPVIGSAKKIYVDDRFIECMLI